MPRKKKATRQANGSSKPRQVSPHSWRVEVPLGRKPDGSRDRRFVFAPTDEEATAKARDLQLRHGRGLTTQTSTVTFGEWLTIWLEQRAEYLEIASQELYATYQRLYIPKPLQDVRLQALRVSDFKELAAHLVTTGLTRQTRAKVISVCNQSLREAVLREFIAVNPCDAVRVHNTKADDARAQDPTAKALTDDEMDRFLTAAKDHELFSLFYCMFSLGLRIGEGLGLRWEDLDLENRKARIVQQVKLADGKWVLGILKTPKSRRTLPVSEDLAAVLEAHRWAQDEARHILGAGWQDHGLIFASGVGTPRDKNNVNKAITRLRIKAGVKPFSSHGCRHTRITAMLKDGVDPEVVAKFAGHSNSTITRTTYRTVFETELPTVSLKSRREDVVKARAVKAKADKTHVGKMSATTQRETKRVDAK